MKLKKVMLAIAVGVLAALFIGFLIDAIYEMPKYEDFCKSSMYYDMPKAVPSQVTQGTVCNFTYNQTLRNECVDNGGYVDERYDEYGCVMNESCNYCSRDYNTANEEYNLNLFYMTAPIGLLLILLGLYLPATIDAIAGGVLLGGILTMIQITMRVFGNLGKWSRVILLGMELVIVIWIGIKKVRDGVVINKNMFPVKSKSRKKR